MILLLLLVDSFLLPPPHPASSFLPPHLALGPGRLTHRATSCDLTIWNASRRVQGGGKGVSISVLQLPFYRVVTGRTSEGHSSCPMALPVYLQVLAMACFCFPYIGPNFCKRFLHWTHFKWTNSTCLCFRWHPRSLEKSSCLRGCFLLSHLFRIYLHNQTRSIRPSQRPPCPSSMSVPASSWCHGPPLCAKPPPWSSSLIEEPQWLTDLHAKRWSWWRIV